MVQQMMQFMAQQEELRTARYAQERREEAAQKREEALIAARERGEEQAVSVAVLVARRDADVLPSATTSRIATRS